jgi:hypothetical protein
MPWLCLHAPASVGRLRSFLAAIAIAMMVGGASGRAESPSQAGCAPSPAGEAFRHLPAPYAPSAGTEIVHTRIGGHDFFVPRNFFRHPQIGCGVEEKAMLLRVLLPEMEGYTEENAREIEGVDKPGWGRKMNILVQPFGRLSGYNRRMFHASTGGVDPTAAYPKQHGLLYTPSNRIRNGGPRSAVDVFFDRENGNLIRFIVCSGVTAVPSPGCQHRFVYENLRVDATYDRKRLASWADIESKVRALLDRFRKAPVTEG